MNEELIDVGGKKVHSFYYPAIISKSKYDNFTLQEYKFYIQASDWSGWEDLPKSFPINRVLEAPHNLEKDYFIQHDVIAWNPDREKFAGAWMKTLPNLISELNAEGVDQRLANCIINVKQIINGYKEKNAEYLIPSVAE